VDRPERLPGEHTRRAAFMRMRLLVTRTAATNVRSAQWTGQHRDSAKLVKMWTSVVVVLIAAAQFGQSSTGELRVSVRDSSGLPVQCRVSLVSEANDVSQQLDTSADGLSVVKRLPFGRYRIAIQQPGLASYEVFVEINSAVPKEYHVTLTPAPLQAQVTVLAGETLLDTHQPTAVNRVGPGTLQRRITTLPRRSLSDVLCPVYVDSGGRAKHN
jgi:hypothetical protein